MNSIKDESGGSSSTSSNIIFIGPVIEAEFSNKVFLEGYYMMTITDYEFSDTGAELSRNDINLDLGYMFMHNAGVYAGYREETFKGKNSTTTATHSGPLVGLRGSIPMNDALSVYGDLAYLFLSSKLEGGFSDSEKAPGPEIEAGVRYAFSREFAGNLGYKYESIKGKDTGEKVTFSGFTLDMKYIF
jgi:opacity protein-like surface antigen